MPDTAFAAKTGSYYRVTNPAFGTGIAQSVVTAFTAASPLMVFFNQAAVGGASIYMDYIKLICSAAGASSVSGQMALILDTIDRWTSGGTRLSPAVGVNSGFGSGGSKARVDFGAIVSPAASAARQLSRDSIKTQASPCWVVGDEVFIKFDAAGPSPGLTSGTVTSLYPAPTGPAIIAPGHSLLLYLWNPSNAVTPPSWEVEAGWWEAA
jgi:hypothetical protein